MKNIPFKRFSAGSAPIVSGHQICVFKESEKEHQLVSCLMVTRGNMNLIRQSYSSFKSQTWKNRELVIVCAHVSDELRNLAADDEREVRLVEIEDGTFTLGDLRNLSVARSQGEFICQWDDDDLYDPDRISISMKVLIGSSVDAVFLCRLLLWWESRGQLSISSSRVWEGSILARRSVIPIYPSIKKGEDSAVTDWISRYYPISVIDYPQLYCYRVTGYNTSDDKHFEKWFAHSTKVFQKDEFAAVFSLPCFNHNTIERLRKAQEELEKPVTLVK